MDAVLPVYKDAVVAGFYNECVVAAVRAIVDALPKGRLLRVLEIGAGTGGTAASVLPALRRACACYTFTDVSESFLRGARGSFAAEYPFVEYELLNIDADPRLQGFASAQYDLVITTNTLHATPFMSNTLRNCRQLLAPGGLLLINDAQRTSAFAQITFGLTDGRDGGSSTNQPIPSAWATIARSDGMGTHAIPKDPGVLQVRRLPSRSRGRHAHV